MPGHYQHVSGRQVDVAMRKLRGLGADELPKPMTAPFCEKCKVIAKIHTMRCPSCRKQVKMQEMTDKAPAESDHDGSNGSVKSKELVSAFAMALENVLKDRPPGP